MKNIFFDKSHTHTQLLCYNRNKLKAKTKLTIGFIGVLSVAAGVQASNIVAEQAAADANTTFQVNVVESLTVSVTTPSDWASGSMNTFLRNTVGLSVASNSSSGFTASMYADTANTTNATDLLNKNDSTSTIETLSSQSAKSAFPSNAWGYSLSSYTAADPNDDSTPDTIAGNNSSVYKPLSGSSTTPNTVLYSSSAASSTQNIFFGAKADATKPSGTYESKVVISVVSGVVNNNTNPITPTNPATPATPNTPTYSGSGTTTGVGSTTVGGSSANGTTTYTTTSNNTSAGTTTNTTTVTAGDTTASYPLGVTEYTDTSVNSSSPLATGLAVTAGVAAASGTLFFILAKRGNKNDEDEEA